MRLAPAVVALTLLAAPLRGQDPFVPVAVIDAPAFVTAGNRLVLLPGEATRSRKPLKWKLVSPKGAPFRVEGLALILRDPAPGAVYKFALVADGDGDDWDVDFAEVPVLGTGPSPTPTPTPPEPTPTPVPPKPEPTPDPAPAEGIVAHLKVVILFEKSSALTRDQRNAIYSTKTLRPYLDSHCFKDEAGRPQWRMFDRDTLTTYEPAWAVTKLQALAEMTPLPRIVVFSGQDKVGSHTIVNEDDLMTWLRSKGGP